MMGEQCVNECSKTGGQRAGKTVEELIQKVDAEQRERDDDDSGPRVTLAKVYVKKRGKHALYRELAAKITRAAWRHVTHPLNLRMKQVKPVAGKIPRHHQRLSLAPI